MRYCKKLMGQGFEDDQTALFETEQQPIPFTELHLVKDSDSSQTTAVSAVKNGVNLVIQGPPGTGKSQTITNIIGEALADNKRVLFVAEKMAALEVVKRRLDECHLGDAVLELHSPQKQQGRCVRRDQAYTDARRARYAEPRSRKSTPQSAANPAR